MAVTVEWLFSIHTYPPTRQPSHQYRLLFLLLLLLHDCPITVTYLLCLALPSPFPLRQSAGLKDTNAALKALSDILGWLIDFPVLWFSMVKSHVEWQCLNHASFSRKSKQSIPLPLEPARHLSSCRLCYSFPLHLLFFFSITIHLYIHPHHSPSE